MLKQKNKPITATYFKEIANKLFLLAMKEAGNYGYETKI